MARHAYNWGLALCQSILEHNQQAAPAEKLKFPSAVDLHKKLVAEVKSANPWYYDVSKCTPQPALRNLITAFNRFFAQQARFPRFKKKGRDDSFYLEGNIRISF
ncbi:hypothetical protein NBE99_07075 [Thermosynechococcus sp. HN-54]|nr:hypothetical protein NBE99_07075 [Thermosynechococcus sp. HN-54]